MELEEHFNWLISVFEMFSCNFDLTPELFVKFLTASFIKTTVF